MRCVALFLALVTSQQALARASALFANTGEYVKVIVQGPQGDTDAPRLFALMNADSVSSGNTFTKSMTFTDKFGAQSFEMMCSVSKTIPDYGSCTITVKKSYYAIIQRTAERKYMAYSVTHVGDARKMASHFRIAEPNTIFFRSNDGRLEFSFGTEPGENFAVVYVEKLN